MAEDKKLIPYYKGRPLNSYSKPELITIIEEQFDKEKRTRDKHIEDMNTFLEEKR